MTLPKFSSHPIRTATPPMIARLTTRKSTNYLRNLCTTAGKEARSKRRAAPCIGMKRVRAQNPFDRPKTPALRPRFKIMAFCKERAKALRDKYKLFVAAYRACCQELRLYFESAPCLNSDSCNAYEKKFASYIQKPPPIIWPSGCYVPTTHKPVVA